MNSEFKKILKFKGYGNPKNSVWFIGIEEALEYHKNKPDQPYHKEVVLSQKRDYHRDKAKFLKANPGRRYTSIYDIIGKIMSGITGISYETYLNDYLFTKEGNCFQTNYYPLGKRNAKTPFPEKYKKWFDIKSESEYVNLVKKFREKELYNFWVKSEPKITIACGIENWENIRGAFKLTDSNFKKIDDKMVYYPEKNFILCPFFVNHQMSGERIKKLVTKIKSIERKE